MRIRDIFDLVAVAVLFGGAFLFMRVAAPEFGAIPLIEVRLAAAVSASFCYGLAAVLMKRSLTGVAPISVAAGSTAMATIILSPLAVWFWPDKSPSFNAWVMTAVLGVACTALAFVLYFRLIASVGPTKAITVTFLIPVFAVVLGALMLDEPITLSMIAGGAIILLGTGMSTGYK